MYMMAGAKTLAFSFSAVSWIPSKWASFSFPRFTVNHTLGFLRCRMPLLEGPILME